VYALACGQEWISARYPCRLRSYVTSRSWSRLSINRRHFPVRSQPTKQCRNHWRFRVVVRGDDLAQAAVISNMTRGEPAATTWLKSWTMNKTACVRTTCASRQWQSSIGRVQKLIRTISSRDSLCPCDVYETARRT